MANGLQRKGPPVHIMLSQKSRIAVDFLCKIKDTFSCF
jgi:hypothetical protein